jgi:3-oxoadipate enol-lactonase
MIGHDTCGSGPSAVMVLNDWIGDTSTWDGARAYLDGARFTWVFADLRGYGRSRGQSGAFTVEEAAGDAIELADSLGFRRFAIVGHSMSSLVALHLAQHLADRIERAVVLAPPPPAGFGADDARLESMRAIAWSDDASRMASLRARMGDRLTEGWIRFKAERWRACADPEAIAGYVAMFARRGLPDMSARITCPVLAVTGERDMEVMRRVAVTSLLTPLCDRLAVVPLAESGHYPMQEAPPILVAIVERFLGEGPGPLDG